MSAGHPSSFQDWDSALMATPCHSQATLQFLQAPGEIKGMNPIKLSLSVPPPKQHPEFWGKQRGTCSRGCHTWPFVIPVFLKTTMGRPTETPFTAPHTWNTTNYCVPLEINSEKAPLTHCWKENVLGKLFLSFDIVQFFQWGKPNVKPTGWFSFSLGNTQLKAAQCTHTPPPAAPETCQGWTPGCQRAARARHCPRPPGCRAQGDTWGTDLTQVLIQL